jgi:hypothetical protein
MAKDVNFSYYQVDLATEISSLIKNIFFSNLEQPMKT